MIETGEDRVITVFEDTTSQLDNYQTHVQNLYALRDIVGVNNFSLQTDGRFRIMHYVGFFQKGQTRVQVLPKVFKKSSVQNADIENRNSLDFIYQMLYWSGFLRHKGLQPQPISSSATDLLEIFISLFINDFNSLFNRKVYRTYEERIETQQFIKGKILFSETIRTSPILRHQHVVKFDEYSINNPLNRIFKSLLLLLLRKTNSNKTKKLIARGLTHLEDVEFVPLTYQQFDSIKFNRLNWEFESLFNFAKLFFKNHQPGLSKGDESTLSFMVPLNDLFESFVARILINFNNTTFTFHHQKYRKYLMSFPIDEILLKPDFSVTKGKEVITIMDAKYKDPFNGKSEVDLKESDVYQLCAYALRYKVKNLFLIYPKFIDSNNSETILKLYQIDSGFGTINLRAIQIDIFEKDLTVLTDRLNKEAYNLFVE